MTVSRRTGRNKLLEKINRLRHNNFKEIEEQQSFIFEQNATQSMLIKSADITSSIIPHNGEVTRNTEVPGFSQMYQMAGNVPKSRSQSLVNNEDSFLFQYNKLLE